MPVHYVFVSPFPPTRSGLATFTASLRRALVANRRGSARVIRVVDEADGLSRPDADAELVAGDAESLRRAAAQINLGDIAIVQYEPGVYGGQDGSDILALLNAIRVPRVLVLHSVPAAPTWQQRWTLQSALTRVEAVVVMTEAARDCLLAFHEVGSRKLHVIPHGAHDVGALLTGSARSGHPTVLTWGLLAPGKGIEWGIEAMSALTSLDPPPRYVVAGPTSSQALLQEGEAYRKQLQARVSQLGLDDLVEFDDRYRDTTALGRLIRTADVVLLPYDSRDLVTSGVLSEAVAALLPVVATRFPHAVELLAGGAGQLVDYRDPAGIATALRAVLTDRTVASRMRRAAALVAPSLHWSAVARRYRELAATLLPSDPLRPRPGA